VTSCCIRPLSCSTVSGSIAFTAVPRRTVAACSSNSGAVSSVRHGASGVCISPATTHSRLNRAAARQRKQQHPRRKGHVMANARRRGRGEGTIRQRADGRWEVRIDLGRGIDGKRRRKSSFAATQAEAIQLLRKLGGRAAEGQLLTTSTPTVSTHLEEWFATNRDTWRPSTHRPIVPRRDRPLPRSDVRSVTSRAANASARSEVADATQGRARCPPAHYARARGVALGTI